MDFRRIEEIFIAVFAILNIFLIGSFWQDEAAVHQTATSDRDTTILKEMRSDQISFSKFSDHHVSGYYASASQGTYQLRNNMKRLVGQNTRIVDNKLVSTFTTPFAYDKKNPRKTMDTFMASANSVLMGSEYHFNAGLTNSNQIVYTQMIDDMPIYSYSGQIVFHIDESGQVTGYTQGYLEDINNLREKSPLISQLSAVTWLYQYNEIQNNSKIMWAKLGYTRLLTSDNGLTYVPTWVIAVKNKNSTTVQTKRINAFSGVLIKRDTTTNEADGTTATTTSSSSVTSSDASTTTDSSATTTSSAEVSSTGSSKDSSGDSSSQSASAGANSSTTSAPV